MEWGMVDMPGIWGSGMGLGPATLHDNLIVRVDIPNMDLVGKPKEKPCYGRAHPDAVLRR